MIKELRIAKLLESSICPTRKHPSDAGLDLYAAEDRVIEPFSCSIVPTGITIETPQNYVGLVMSKSRNDFLLGGGVVDAGYQGEILVKVVNYSGTSIHIMKGQAIGQYLLIPIETPVVVEVPVEQIHQIQSERGKSGGIASQNFQSN